MTLLPSGETARIFPIGSDASRVIVLPIASSDIRPDVVVTKALVPFGTNAIETGSPETCTMMRAGKQVLKLVVVVLEVTVPTVAMTRAAPGPRAVARPLESMVTTDASVESQEKPPIWFVMSVVPLKACALY